MNQAHEYAVLGGVNRANIGRILALGSASISGGIVFLLLALFDIAHRFGLPTDLRPEVVSMVSAGSVFAVLYWILNRYAWRWPGIGQWLNVPNLRGEWRCHGETINPDGTVQYTWDGTLTITQSWDRLRVRLKTPQSGSNSISAAMAPDDIEGCVLLYHYQNDPKVGEPELRTHRGFAEIIFDKDFKSAEGEYFNGHGRNTFGRMRLTKVI